MTRRTLLAVQLAAVTLAIFTLSATAQPDPGSKAELLLNRARERYEKDMERLRSRVDRAIQRSRDDASKLSEGKAEAAGEIHAAESSYRATGTLPDVEHADRLEQEYAKCAQRMREAYEDAMLSPGATGTAPSVAGHLAALDPFITA